MIIVSEPIIELPVDDILVRFDHGDKWIQDSWKNGQGECLHNGIRACMPRKGDAFLIEQVAEVYGWGTDWNDEPGRTFDDIKQTLVEHREVFPHELLATFGPQWEPMVALVRRIADLTVGEVQELRTALAAHRDNARAAARAAARNAARNADRVAAWDAAWNAAWDAELVAAWVAARATAGRSAAAALAVRDLIDPNGFTQEHYDTLTGPWKSVIGKVHPDD